MHPDLDGVNHINIYSKGVTALGRWLSNFTYEPIEIPVFGRFASVEAYWYWLGARDDDLRPLHGYPAKQLGQRLPRVEILPAEDFQDFIREAMRLKLRANRLKAGEFIDSDLPFAHYYYYGTKVHMLPKYQWIVDEWERLREKGKKWRASSKR